jgi:hypothetical protein
MSQQNLVSFSIPDKDLEEVKSAIATLKSKLVPHLKTLSSTDRIELPKMGDKTIAFVQKAYDHCEQNPDIAPKFLDVEEFKNDLTAFEQIRTIYAPLSQVVDSLSDTMLLSGSDAYAGALVFYQTVKTAAKSNIQPGHSIYTDLSSRFPGNSKAKAAAASK